MSPQDTSGAQVTTTPITPMPARLALRILSADDVLCLHAAALELLGAQGAAAEAAALSAPDAVVLGGRVPEHDVTLGAGCCWLATGGPAVRVRPREGGDPRPATVEDLEEACRLADALPEVAVVYGPPVRPVGETALSELARCLAATSKHIQLSTLRTAAEAEAAVRMALAVAGSDDALRERPLLSLCAGTDSLAAAEVFAGAGLPVGAVTPAAAGDAGSRPAASGPAAGDTGPER